MKKLLFLTATRADFGKLKSLIKLCQLEDFFSVRVFITGMHMLPEYGETRIEVIKSGINNTFSYINQCAHESLDKILVNTIQGLSDYVKINKPDMIIVHGDRTETLAGAVVGAFNNIYVGHIEGGEVSGTIDESIRHAVSKLAHFHFVANEKAKARLIQMGENDNSIFVIGSPDVDIMLSKNLPSIKKAKKYYDILYRDYALLLYHPVTTIKTSELSDKAKNVIEALQKSSEKYIVIYPNNDPGNDIIQEHYHVLSQNPNFKIFPSIRFEYFLVLLKYSKFIIGNSSAGVREAPYYGVPTINLGLRQEGRHRCSSVYDIEEKTEDILQAINKVKSFTRETNENFGEGKSAENFVQLLKNREMWETKVQKKFVDYAIHEDMS